jgi:uncharacterized membrane protein
MGLPYSDVTSDERPHAPAWLRPTRGEHRWPAATALAVVIALQLALPKHLVIGPLRLLTVIEVLLFCVLVAANPVRINRETLVLRVVGLVFVGIASIGPGFSVVKLVVELVSGPAFPPKELLLSAAAIWVNNVIVFALWYWEGDRGGPAARANARLVHPDFLFPHMTVPELVGKEWEPTFVDYLYLSFTNTTAFSPTDTLPMSWWAKLVMMAQSAVSLVTVGLIVARAVNILH